MHNIYHKNLHELQESGNFRSLPKAETLELIDLCSNDYLGINANQQLHNEFVTDHLSEMRFSAASSRLLSKHLEPHQLLENKIANAYESEAALLFNSGYHANTGILSSLPQSGDLIIADKLIHASVIDGAKLSKADFKRYRHLDYQHLDRLLSTNRAKYNNIFIVSESIFSMDGDVADLSTLVSLKKKHGCFLFIDEAHALGVSGERGLGYCEVLNCFNDIDFIVGTMGKAMASMGAFVACNHTFKNYLINHARSFIFSTALPPVNVAWSSFVFDKMQKMQTERQHLQQLSDDFSALIKVKTQSHIVPYIIGSNAKAIAKSDQLKQAGFNVLPVRYPTVPKNTARLRFSLNANMHLKNLVSIKNYITDNHE